MRTPEGYGKASLVCGIASVLLLAFWLLELLGPGRGALRPLVMIAAPWGCLLLGVGAFLLAREARRHTAARVETASGGDMAPAMPLTARLGMSFALVPVVVGSLASLGFVWLFIAFSSMGLGTSALTLATLACGLVLVIAVVLVFKLVSSTTVPIDGAAETLSESQQESRRITNRRQWILLGAVALIIVVLAALPVRLLPPGLSSLRRHQAIGVLVVLTPIVLAVLRVRALRKEGARSRRRVATGCVAVALLPAALVAFLWLFTYDIDFDSADWRRDCWGSWGDTDSHARMVSDLMENHLRIGMPQAEVEEMLGHGLGGGSWMVNRGFMGPEILYVSYEEGRVTGFKVVDHD